MIGQFGDCKCSNLQGVWVLHTQPNEICNGFIGKEGKVYTTL